MHPPCSQLSGMEPPGTTGSCGNYSNCGAGAASNVGMNTLLMFLAASLLQDPKPVIVEAGPLTCEIHISRTATIFHVVDQLAEWSEYCHRQYGRHFARGLTAFDRDLLD